MTSRRVALCSRCSTALRRRTIESGTVVVRSAPASLDLPGRFKLVRYRHSRRTSRLTGDLSAQAKCAAHGRGDRRHGRGADLGECCQRRRRRLHLILSDPEHTEHLKLTADLASCGDCLVVASNRITIDLQGHSITGDCESSAGVTDGGIARDWTVVKNGSISSFTVGVLLASSRRNQVQNIQVMTNVIGIWAGTDSLVKSCSATSNSVFQDEDGYGIIVGDRSQVEGCDASFNGRVGILAGNHCLITRNTAIETGQMGSQPAISHRRLQYGQVQ